MRLCVSPFILAERKGVGRRDTEADRKRSSWCYHGWGRDLWLPRPNHSTYTGYSSYAYTHMHTPTDAWGHKCTHGYKHEHVLPHGLSLLTFYLFTVSFVSHCMFMTASDKSLKCVHPAQLHTYTCTHTLFGTVCTDVQRVGLVFRWDGMAAQ